MDDSLKVGDRVAFSRDAIRHMDKKHRKKYNKFVGTLTRIDNIWAFVDWDQPTDHGGVFAHALVRYDELD